MRSPLILAIAASMVLAGCGASGGGSALVPIQHNPQGSSNTDAQSAAQAAMTPVSTGDMTAGLLGGSYGSTLSVIYRPSNVRALSQTCVHRHEFFVTVISQTETKYEVKYFYDSACTQLAKDVIAYVTIPDASNESIARTAVWYNQAGTQLANRSTNFNITGATGNFAAVLTSAFFVGSSQQPTNQFGGEFDVAAQNSNTFTIAGDHADVYNDVRPSVNASFGVSAALQNATASIDSSGDVTFAGSRNVSLSYGPLYALSIPTAPPFSVSGGSVIGSGSATGSVEFDAAGQLMAVNVTVNTIKGFTVVMTSSGQAGSISINGTVTNSSNQQVATFTVDQYGDGVITFANGTQALIIDWHIVG